VRPAVPVDDALKFRSRVRGCLLGGAIGDALGGPVEFEPLDAIRARVGNVGVRDYLPISDVGTPRYGLVTDDTQMTLFTVEGLIRAGVRRDRGLGLTIDVVHSSYHRWLDTQLNPGPSDKPDGWLMGHSWLYARRAPGMTCLEALHQNLSADGRPRRFGDQAANNSKGCGGVMRATPYGLLPIGDLQFVFDNAARGAGYTHGHPTGRIAAGAFAAIVRCIVDGQDLDTALDSVTAIAAGHDGHEETLRALDNARDASTSPTAGSLESLGQGWVAEEALAIGVFAALAHPGPDEVLDALALAVTHSGDSDSTGSICGNILGALHGEIGLPRQLLFEVEGRGTILELADDFVDEFTRRDELHAEFMRTRWTARYPGW